MPLDRDRAIITLVDSNIQRENVLPSERAFAYKMKLEAMKRRVSAPIYFVPTWDEVADRRNGGAGLWRRQDHRTAFYPSDGAVPPILQKVDEEKIALTPAVELSFLKKDEQENLLITMESEGRNALSVAGAAYEKVKPTRAARYGYHLFH